MKKEIRLTLLSFLVTVFVCLIVSQPSDNLTHLTRLQRYLLTLYEQYEQNASAVNLDSFMDSRLISRWHGIIDLIRGWAVDEHEEERSVRESLNYMRSVVLYTCVTYADSLYDSYTTADSIDADIIFQASQIFQIRTNYRWVSLPSNQIARFELMRFHQFGVRNKAVYYSPYIQFYSTNTASARFFREVLPPSENRFLLPEMFDITPLPRNPRANLANELDMLVHAQRYLLMLYNFTKSSSDKNRLLRNELFYMNAELQCVMKERFETFLRQWNLTTTRYRDRTAWQSFMWTVVLRRCMEFAFSDYVRHIYHPAHINFACLSNASVIATLNEDHVRLMRAYGELIADIEEMTAHNVMMTAFNSFIFELPLRVGYVRYDETVRLRIGLDCQNSIPN